MIHILLIVPVFYFMLRFFKQDGSSFDKTSSEASADEIVESCRIYIAKGPLDSGWLAEKVRFSWSPSACLQLTNYELFYHSKNAPPVKLKSIALIKLFEDVGTGWSRIASQDEAVRIRSVLEDNGEETKALSTKLNRGVSI